MPDMTKKCSKCKIVKDCSEFSRRFISKDGLQYKCKSCTRKYDQNKSKKGKGKFSKKPKQCSNCKLVKNFLEFHKQSASKDGLQSYCKSCMKKRNKNYYQENREELLKYQQEHKEKIAEYKKTKKQEDINFKLACYLRSRLSAALKNNQKSGSAVEDLGCSIEELRIHLENQFQPGMNWNNWSRGGWHIDHIIPLSSFDLSDREQLKKACYYTNLQPLWAKDNIRKGVKF